MIDGLALRSGIARNFVLCCVQPSPILHPRRTPGKTSLGAEQQFAAQRSADGQTIDGTRAVPHAEKRQ